MLCDSDNMPHTITLQHAVVERDGYGGDETSYGAAYETAEPAWVQTPSASQIKEFRYRDQNVTHAVYLTRNPGILLDDRITINDGPYAGTVLAPVSFREATVGMSLLWVVMCTTDLENRSTP